MGNSHQPIRILSYQQVIRVGQPLLPSVGFVGFSGVGLKKKCYCMHRGGCSSPSGMSYWYGVFIFQLTICLLRERSGHPTFKFRNHFFFLFDSVTCIPYRSCLGRGFCSFWGWGIPTSHSCILYLLFKLLVSKIMAILSSLQGRILFNMFFS